MAGSRYITPFAYAYQPTGVPIPGALLNFYVTTSSTRADTFTTADLSGPANANPVVANDAGTFPAIFLDPAVVYKVVLTYPVVMGAVEVWTADPVYVTMDNGTPIDDGDDGGGIDLGIPAGAVMVFAQNTTPSGWLSCNGAAVARTLYPDLFLAIGSNYGAGDGVTTFNVPDLRGEFVRGWDNARGVDAGRAFASTQASDFTSHTHVATGSASVDDPGHAHEQMRDDATGAENSSSGDANPDASHGITPYGLTSTATTGIAVTVAVSNTATGGAETRPRNVAMHYCIKT